MKKGGHDECRLTPSLPARVTAPPHCRLADAHGSTAASDSECSDSDPGDMGPCFPLA